MDPHSAAAETLIPTSTTVSLDLHHSLNLPGWAMRADKGDVPDAVPYGLDKLSGFGFEVVDTSFARGATMQNVDRAARGVGGGFDWLRSSRRQLANRADVRLCWEERNGVPAGLTRRETDSRVATGVIWLTESDFELSPPVRRLVRYGLSRCSAVWALSSAQLPVLRSEWGVEEGRLHHLLFGIDSEFWSPTGEDSQQGHILGIGNDRHRDHQLLLEAMALVCRTIPSAKLALITNQQLVIDTETTTQIGSLPHRSVRDHYAAASIVAVALKPNLHVSGMTAILEAQASGRPVVCTDTPGVRDYIVDGETGLLVPPGDAHAFAAAIQSLLSDPERAKALGVAGRRFVTTKRDTTHQASRLADIIGTVR